MNRGILKLSYANIRYELQQRDLERIRCLAQATGFFSEAEIRIAEELAQDRISKGDSSGYHFVLSEQDDRLLGYTCYGPIACTLSSYDVYWIAVQPEIQGGGLGRRLIEETERLIRQSGGTRIYAETSQRPQYDGTRIFYRNAGYRMEAVIPDFYAPCDSKIIFCKVLT